MGMDLARESLLYWIEGSFEHSQIFQIIKINNLIEEKVGHQVDISKWDYYDKTSLRIGSYLTYSCFRIFLSYLTDGLFIKEMEPLDNEEIKTIEYLEKRYSRHSLSLPYINQFLNSGDTDTIFIPAYFDSDPIEIEELFIASKPAAIRALMEIGKQLKIDLCTPMDEEGDFPDDYKYDIIALNVARKFYQYFTDKPDACVVIT